MARRASTIPERIADGSPWRPIRVSRSASAARTSASAPSWWPSTVTRISVVVAPDALSADWRQHQRRALTRPASSMKITSPGSGDSRSPEPRSVKRSVAGREADGRAARRRALVEDGHREAVANAHEVAEVDERVDRRDGALLGEPSKERLGRRAVAGRDRRRRPGTRGARRQGSGARRAACRRSGRSPPLAPPRTPRAGRVASVRWPRRSHG